MKLQKACKFTRIINDCIIDIYNMFGHFLIIQALTFLVNSIEKLIFTLLHEFHSIRKFNYEWIFRPSSDRTEIYFSNDSVMPKSKLELTQPEFTCSKLAIDISEQFVESAQTNKDTTSLTLLCCLYCWIWPDFTHCSVSIVDSEQVNDDWELA